MSARFAVTGITLAFLIAFPAFAGMLADAGNDPAAMVWAARAAILSDPSSGSLIWD